MEEGSTSANTANGTSAHVDQEGDEEESGYYYKSILDILQSGSNTISTSGVFVHHVIGVVTFSNVPRCNAQQKWFMTIGLTDDSITDSHGHYTTMTKNLLYTADTKMPRILLTCFADAQENLPTLRTNGGEILILHRVKREFHHGRGQLCCTFKTRFGPSAWAAWSGDCTTSRELRTSCNNFTMTGRDWNRVHELHHWFTHLQRNCTAKQVTRLSDIISSNTSSTYATHWINIRVHVLGVLYNSELCASIPAEHIVLIVTDGSALSKECSFKTPDFLLLRSEENVYDLESMLRVQLLEKEQQRSHLLFLRVYDDWAVEVKKRLPKNFSPFTIQCNNVAVRKCSHVVNELGLEDCVATTTMTEQLNTRLICSLTMNGGEYHGRSIMWTREPSQFHTSQDSNILNSEESSEYLNHLPQINYVTRITHNRIGNVPFLNIALTSHVARPRGRCRFRIVGLITDLYPRPLPTQHNQSNFVTSTPAGSSNASVSSRRECRSKRQRLSAQIEDTTVICHVDDSRNSVVLRSYTPQCPICDQFILSQDCAIPTGILPMDLRTIPVTSLPTHNPPSSPSNSLQIPEPATPSFVSASSSVRVNDISNDEVENTVIPNHCKEVCSHSDIRETPLLGIQVTDFSGSLWLTIIGVQAIDEFLIGLLPNDPSPLAKPFNELWNNSLIGRPIKALAKCEKWFEEGGPWLHLFSTTLKGM